MRRFCWLLLLLTGCGAAGAFRCKDGADALSGLVRVEGASGERHIVVLRPQAARALQTEGAPSLEQRYGVSDLEFLVVGELSGFTCSMSAAEARVMASREEILFVQQDGPKRIPEPLSFAPLQTASWGLDRIDQRTLPLDGSYQPDGNGAGSDLCIIDTGGDLDHAEFSGRIGECWSSVAADCRDGHGHGTHVAGTAAGSGFGVARQARLHFCKALADDGSGSDSTVIRCLTWCTEVQQRTGRPMAINMSLGGPESPAVDLAVCQAIEKGITVLVAAGNAAADACEGSPSRVDEALTVGATASDDRRALFSNHGPCVDLFAPGEAITSAWPGGGSQTVSGTSMATPHVAGAAALCAQRGQDPAACIVDGSTPDVVRLAGTDSPNRLLYVGQDATPAGRAASP